MGAPKGNQFWKLRSKHGRDKIFTDPEVMREAAYEYFSHVVNNPLESLIPVKAGDHFGETVSVPMGRPFTKERLCIFWGCNTKYLANFKRGLTKDDKDFINVINEIEDIIYSQKFEGAAVGIFNHNIIARDLGLSDKQNVDHTTGGDKLNQINVTVDNSETAKTLKKLRDGAKAD